MYLSQIFEVQQLSVIKTRILLNVRGPLFQQLKEDYNKKNLRINKMGILPQDDSDTEPFILDEDQESNNGNEQTIPEDVACNLEYTEFDHQLGHLG